MDRRSFLSATAVGIAGIGLAGPLNPFSAPAGAAPGLGVPLYRRLVPEIFRPAPTAPSHSENLVIGSGFGAAVTSLRLAQAGRGVTMLERGSRWPIDPWRNIHAWDPLPDGRGFWHRTRFQNLTGLPPTPFDDFGGVFDATDYPGISVWRGAGVGGGSLVFTGVLIEPEKRFFTHVFGKSLDYGEMHNVYYPMARRGLNARPMPDDIYNSIPFTHSRVWDQQSRKAGYSPQRLDSIWDWEMVRAELAGRVRPSAINGESNLGNSTGVKNDLRLNYLKLAEATGRTTIHPGHQVTAIGRERDGRYRIEVDVIDATGALLRRRTLTADNLFLGAGSIGTSELLVKARATGALPDLNEHVGTGWGTNGDAALVRGLQTSGFGIVQGSPSASRIADDRDMPLTLENWYVPGNPVDLTLIGSLGMTLDPRRADFRYVPETGKVTLDWPAHGNDDTIAALRRVNTRVAEANGIGVGFPPLAKDVNASFTAHPLGGAVLGKATDSYGRVIGYDGLHVVDGALIPGSTGTVNPTLTITALAERNIGQVIRDGL